MMNPTTQTATKLTCSGWIAAHFTKCACSCVAAPLQPLEQLPPLLPLLQPLAAVGRGRTEPWFWPKFARIRAPKGPIALRPGQARDATQGRPAPWWPRAAPFAGAKRAGRAPPPEWPSVTRHKVAEGQQAPQSILPVRGFLMPTFDASLLQRPPPQQPQRTAPPPALPALPLAPSPLGPAPGDAALRHPSLHAQQRQPRDVQEQQPLRCGLQSVLPHRWCRAAHRGLRRPA